MTPTGMWQRSLIPLKVFYVWEFPTSNTAQHSACTGAPGLFAHPVALVIGWWVLCRFRDICVSNTDCLWNESGVPSKHSFWRIRGLYCDRQVLQALLNDVCMWTNCIYCRLPVVTVGWTGCCSSQWRSWPFVTETVELKNQSCVRFPFIWLCYLKIVKRGKKLFFKFMHSAANFTAPCTPPPPPPRQPLLHWWQSHVSGKLLVWMAATLLINLPLIFYSTCKLCHSSLHVVRA
jgi:hypothetical protein